VPPGTTTNHATPPLQLDVLGTNLQSTNARKQRNKMQLNTGTFDSLSSPSPAFCYTHRLPNMALIVRYQTQLANKNAMFDMIQSFCQPVCFHLYCIYEFQQNTPFLHLLVDPLIADVDMPCIYGLQGIEYSQPDVLAIRMDEQ